ncbi:Ribokinase [Frankia sp. AiPs1]|uniref:ribokinase n=1 Tax=Frankia sp. AiPa1 TaxID=573492 RepID=UPI00202AD9B6|nr:ribokinase [Frankia sp. AiPa1]MCL9762034.1 ribokinase [Frankia sp. AiPa1]
MGRVVVVGSVNMDVTTRVDALPRPGETVRGSAVAITPGGKGANQAVAARRLGAPTHLVGAVGSDGFAATLREFLQAEEIDLAGLARSDTPTGTAVTMVDVAGENVIAVVAGANAKTTATHLTAVGLGPADVLLLQNEIPAEVNADAIARAQAAGACVVLNAAPYRPDPQELLAAVDLLVVNEHELAGLVPQAAPLVTSASDSTWAESQPLARAQLLARVRGLLADGIGPSRNIVVTLGAAGVCARIEDTVVTLAALEMPVVDTTGAGDCFCGALAAGLAGGLPAATALFHANLAASLAIGRPGAAAAMPSRARFDDLLAARAFR